MTIGCCVMVWSGCITRIWITCVKVNDEYGIERCICV